MLSSKFDSLSGVEGRVAPQGGKDEHRDAGEPAK
jgi:hypothetical protein